VLTRPGRDQRQPLRYLDGLEHLELLDGREVGRPAGEVGQLAGVGDPRDRVDDLIGTPLLEQGGHDDLVLAGELTRRLVVLGRRGDDARLDPQRGPRTRRPGADPGAVGATDDSRCLAAGQPADLLDARQRADCGVGAVQTRDEQHLGGLPVRRAGLGGVDRRLHLRLGELQRHDHARQDDGIGERQDRDGDDRGGGERHGDLLSRCLRRQRLARVVVPRTPGSVSGGPRRAR